MAKSSLRKSNSKHGNKEKVFLLRKQEEFDDKERILRLSWLVLLRCLPDDVSGYDDVSFPREGDDRIEDTVEDLLAFLDLM